MAGKIFDARKCRKSIDSLAEMLMKLLCFHTASVYSGGKVLPGLVTRREAEAAWLLNAA